MLHKLIQTHFDVVPPGLVAGDTQSQSAEAEYNGTGKVAA
jgi:hypothetical protein